MHTEHSVSVVALLDEKYDFHQARQLVTNSNATLVAAAKCIEELSALCRHMIPDFIILDMAIATSPENTIRDLLSMTNEQSVVIATSTNGRHDSVYAMSAIEAGASCFVKNIFNGQLLPLTTDPPGRSHRYYNITIPPNEERRFISNILYDLNLSPETPGFHYLRELILEVANSNEFVPEITKEKLHCIANKFRTSVRTIERALNTTLTEINDKNSRRQILRAVTKKELSTDSSFINVKEFVALVADQLRLDYSQSITA
ncbi:MAG: hypothetical protein E7385_07155 [Ruminococcaceae bacterium]|nr:hypothetical protein [Oscillospiraceae bacterium]